MKVKLDENLGIRGRAQLAAAGIDVATVFDQGLTSAPDRSLVEACAREARCLVTLDMGFANPIVFPPETYAGVVVIRLRGAATQQALDLAFETLALFAARNSVTGKLWIVEPGRVREHVAED